MLVKKYDKEYIATNDETSKEYIGMQPIRLKKDTPTIKSLSKRKSRRKKPSHLNTSGNLGKQEGFHNILVNSQTRFRVHQKGAKVLLTT